MATKVVLNTEDGLEWDISNFITKIVQLGSDGRAWGSAELTLIVNTDLPVDGKPLTIDANAPRRIDR